MSTVQRRPAGMRRFIAIFLAFHIPLFVYPVLRLAAWLELGTFLTTLILVPVASSQVISRWVLRDARQSLVRGVRHVADFMLGMSPILLIALLLAEIPVALGILDEGWAAVAVLGLTLLIAIAGIWAALSPMTKTISLTSAKLKAPLRFVQITDVHIGSRSSQFLEGVVAQINELDPEFLCITGDFIDARGVTTADLASLKLLRCPVYFTIGNHERYEDLEEILERLESLGVEVLRSTSRLPRQDVQVLGIDDRDDLLQVERQLVHMNVNREAFSILMYHRPNGLDAASESGVDLMISGHTHNGQIFPFNLVVSRVFDQVVGLHARGDSHLYVSQGTGTWGPVMRVGTRSEITLFEIEQVS